MTEGLEFKSFAKMNRFHDETMCISEKIDGINGSYRMDKIKTDNSGLRYDQEKPRIDLIPPEAITALAEHYTKGAKKYKERNWEAGMDWTRCYNSLMRHANAWMQGEDIDPENGSHHMIAVMWNAVALYWYWLKKVGKDTRPQYAEQATPTGKNLEYFNVLLLS